MSTIAVTAAQVEPVFPEDSSTVIRNYTLLAAVTAGQAIYCDPTTGNAGIADPTISGNEQFRGIALSTRGIGETVRVLERGEISGFTLPTTSYDSIIYLGTTGTLQTTANGTKTVQVGRIKALTTMAGCTPTLYVSSDLLRNW